MLEESKELEFPLFISEEALIDDISEELFELVAEETEIFDSSDISAKEKEKPDSPWNETLYSFWITKVSI